jgi:phosphoribosyl 1,2-cyclic phosphodiesterase
MIVAPLGSGSAGNAYWFESDGTAILVDAGLGPRDTKKRVEAIERDITRLKGVVVTHEHYDHIRGAGQIARRYDVPVYLTRGTLNASNLDPAETKTVVFENNTSFEIGELLVHAQRTIHDARDPACFVVESRDGTRVGLASDLGHVDPPVLKHLSGCDGLFFESNHDLDMLRMGTYPWSLKRRIMSRYGHLSNDDSVHAVQRLLGSDLKTLCMIHLSEKNNNEAIVRDLCTRLLHRTGASIELAIARQTGPNGVFDVARRRPRTPAPGQLSLF